MICEAFDGPDHVRDACDGEAVAILTVRNVHAESGELEYAVCSKHLTKHRWSAIRERPATPTI